MGAMNSLSNSAIETGLISRLSPPQPANTRTFTLPTTEVSSAFGISSHSIVGRFCTGPKQTSTGNQSDGRLGWIHRRELDQSQDRWRVRALLPDTACRT